LQVGRAGRATAPDPERFPGAGIVDPETLNVDFAALRPVGRLCGNGYARQRDTFELRRVGYAEWRARRDKAQS
jgi:hypothetical protein